MGVQIPLPALKPELEGFEGSPVYELRQEEQRIGRVADLKHRGESIKDEPSGRRQIPLPAPWHACANGFV